MRNPSRASFPASHASIAGTKIGVPGILNDLVENGFVSRTGRGEETRYRLATEEERADFGASLEGSAESLAAHVWLQIYREGPTSHDRLTQLVPVSSSALKDAVDLLLKDGRIAHESHATESTYVTEQVLIPIGESAGWEAAVVDHHRAVMNALAAKLTSGTRVSAGGDKVGGTTLTFAMWPGHPKEQEAVELLATVRAAVLPLWDEVNTFDRPDDVKGEYQVHFYCGQYLTGEEKPR